MSPLAMVAVLLVAIRCRPLLAPTRPVQHTVAPPRAACPADTAAWAELLDCVATELRTGSTLSVALEVALAHRPVPGAVLHPGAKFASFARPHPELLRSASADERLAVSALRAAQRVGGPTAATLDDAAAVLRERIALRAEAVVYSTQARASARLLTVLPPAVAIWGAATSATVRSGLASPTGVITTVLGLVCNGIGWWWMQHLVHSSVP